MNLLSFETLTDLKLKATEFYFISFLGVSRDQCAKLSILQDF